MDSLKHFIVYWKVIETVFGYAKILRIQSGVFYPIYKACILKLSQLLSSVKDIKEVYLTELTEIKLG